MSDRPRILIVEDDENVRTSLAALLESAGYDILEAANLGEARTAIAGPLDAVVLDHYLGNDVGTDLIGELRAAHPAIVIAVVSGDPSPIAAADIRMTKSERPSVLLDELRKRFGR